MSNIDFQNGFALGMASKGMAKGSETPNPLECATQLYNTYLNAKFPENTEFTINVPNVTRMSSCFQQATGIVKLIIKGNVAGNVLDCNSAFRINTLETLDLTEFVAKVSTAQTMFGGASVLKEIKGTIDLSSATNVNNMFYNCFSLEEVRFAEISIALSISFAQSSKLSSDSVQSIIDGLATVETAQTLTLHSAIVLTDAQRTTIETKGWTLVQ